MSDARDKVTEAPRGGRVVLPHGARFTCHRCGDCCRSFPVSITEGEAKRLSRPDAKALVPELGERDPFDLVSRGGGRVARFLKRRPSGACVFLDEEKNLCRIHSAIGEGEKPLACRLYPFAPTPGAPDDERPRVDCHFSCKGMAAGDGAPVAGQRREVEALVDELRRVRPLAPREGPIAFKEARSYGREELELVHELLVEELVDAGRPFPERLLAAAKFLDLFQLSSFSEVRDRKRRDFVRALAAGFREQVKKGILSPPGGTPAFPERLLFRQLLGAAVRRDPPSIVSAGILTRASRRLSGFLLGLATSAGGGSFVPTGRERRVRVTDVRRHAPPASGASPEGDAALTRYFAAHLGARRILDPDWKVPEVLPSLGLLLRQFPLILLFARAACLSRGGGALSADDWASALRTADWTFGAVPWTAGFVGRTRARLLADVNAPFRHVAWCAELAR